MNTFVPLSDSAFPLSRRVLSRGIATGKSPFASFSSCSNLSQANHYPYSSASHETGTETVLEDIISTPKAALNLGLVSFSSPSAEIVSHSAGGHLLEPTRVGSPRAYGFVSRRVIHRGVHAQQQQLPPLLQRTPESSRVRSASHDAHGVSSESIDDECHGNSPLSTGPLATQQCIGQMNIGRLSLNAMTRPVSGSDFSTPVHANNSPVIEVAAAAPLPFIARGAEDTEEDMEEVGDIAAESVTYMWRDSEKYEAPAARSTSVRIVRWNS